VAKEIRDLIRKMSTANPGWGSPVGELAKLGIHVAKATVEKYMVRSRRPPSPTWRAFSGRMLPITRSANGFCHGLRGAVRTSSTPTIRRRA
jgi:hypothetical protein